MPRDPDTSAAVADLHYWDRVVDGWTEQQKDALWRAHSDALNSALLARWLPGHRMRHLLKTDLFDEAVSTGLYPLLQRRAQQVTGIDVSPHVVDAARAKYPLLKGVTTDVLGLPFADGEFDAVVSISTLDHFDSVEQIRVALAELHRVLRPGGAFVITLDNGSNPAVALRNRLPFAWLNRMGLVPYRIGATCTPRQFAELLRACRFDIRKVGFTCHTPRVIAVLAARLVEQFGGAASRRRLLRLLLECERLDTWPTRVLTGYYIAAAGTRC